MAKMIDITDKLNFEEKPVLVIKGEGISVNHDVTTVLQVMQLTSKKDISDYDVANAYELLFDDADRKKIGDMNISYKNLVILIDEAIKIIVNGDEEPDTQS